MISPLSYQTYYYYYFLFKKKIHAGWHTRTHPKDWWPPAKDSFVALATRKRLNIFFFYFYLSFPPYSIVCRRDSCAHTKKKELKRCMTRLMWGTAFVFPFSSIIWLLWILYIYFFLPASRSHTLLWFGLTYSEKRFLFLILEKKRNNDLIALFFFFISSGQKTICHSRTRNAIVSVTPHGTWFFSCRLDEPFPIVSSVSSFASSGNNRRVRRTTCTSLNALRNTPLKWSGVCQWINNSEKRIRRVCKYKYFFFFFLPAGYSKSKDSY